MIFKFNCAFKNGSGTFSKFFISDFFSEVNIMGFVAKNVVKINIVVSHKVS